MQNYVKLSLETHLFFARIMKEHALFLEAGFPCQNEVWARTAERLKHAFEEFLYDVVELADGNISNSIIHSGELSTEFTIPAENATEKLSGIAINSRITALERQLRSGTVCRDNRRLENTVHMLNRHSLRMLDELIEFKEDILREVDKQNLFTANYPLLIQHILREAKLYRATIDELLRNGELSSQDLCSLENFWNQIMMEHALFIRGLLDPSEEELVFTAHDFAMDYRALLNQAKQQDCRAMDELTRQSLEETLKYRDFKTAGTEGILAGNISSIILPLLADHVLREANHYIRILEQAKEKEQIQY